MKRPEETYARREPARKRRFAEPPSRSGEHETFSPKMKIMKARTVNNIAQAVIWMAALSVITVLIAIIFYILVMGIPHINFAFLTQAPRDMGRDGGISSTIIGTLTVTISAIAIAMPFGVGTAFYLAEYTRENAVTRIIRFCAEALAGIPSIVFGLFGFIFFVNYLKLGWSVLAGALTLAVMILPTLIRTSEEAIRAVPYSYREVSYSLGGTKWQTIIKVVFPSALRGIVNGIILSVGRCVAETAAVILTAGSALRMRTMAAHFYFLAIEGISMDNAYATAALLIILMFIINVVANTLVHKYVKGGKK